MDDHQRASDLTYGQLGRATYLEKNHEWNFARQIGEDGLEEHENVFPLAFHCFRQICDAEQCVLGRDISDYHESLHSLKPRDLPSLPHLAAASSLLSQHNFVGAEDVESEAAPKNLLAFGSAVKIGHTNAELEPSVPIAAFITGPTGNTLRVASIEARIVHVFSDSFGDPRVRLPTISSHTFADWNVNTQPIRQLAFSPAESAAKTWLAVRQDFMTTIFHPLFHESSPYTQIGIQSRTQLDPNPTLVLPMTRTGGHKHADFAFHPFEPLQFAIVDVHGHWSIWKMTDSKRFHRRPQFSTKLVQHGRLHAWSDQYKPSSPRPHHDGWHAIRWFKRAPDSYWLAVTDRRRMLIFDPSTGASIRPNLQLGSGRQTQWVLDVKSLLDCKTLLVLTSNSLLWISSPSFQNVDLSARPMIEVGHSMRHYRAPSDTTLRLCVSENPLDHFILIFSCVNSLVTAFHCRSKFDDMEPTSLSDPVSFQLGEPGRDREVLSSGTSTKILQLDLREVDHGMQHKDHGHTQLFKLFIVRTNLSICEILLQRVSPNENAISSPQKLRLPLAKRARKSAAVIIDEDLQDFILEPDQFDQRVSSVPSGHILRRRNQSRLEEARTSWAVDWSDVYQTVTGIHLASEGSGKTSQPRQMPFDAAVDQVRNNLSNAANLGPGLTLLFDLSMGKDPLKIDELLEDAMRLGSLEAEIDDSTEIHSTRLWPVRQDTSEQENLSADNRMLNIYRRLLSEFHSPLPLDFPSRMRIAKEKIIRQVTADLALSSISVCRVPQHREPGEEDSETVTSSVLPLAVPQPSQPSQPTQNSPTDPSNILASAYRRLNIYAHLTQPPPSSPPSRSLARILSHLPPPISPTDPILPHPSSYSYTLTRQTEPGSAQQLPPPTRAQAIAAARLQRRRQKEQDLFESSQRERMAPPTVAVSSQPERGRQPQPQPQPQQEHEGRSLRDPAGAPMSSQLPIRPSPQKQRIPPSPFGPLQRDPQAGPSNFAAASQAEARNVVGVGQSDVARMRRDAGPSTPRHPPGFGIGGEPPASSSRRGKRRAGF